MPQITMLEDVWDGPTLLAKGATPTVSTELADNLVGAGKALDSVGYRRARVTESISDSAQGDRPGVRENTEYVLCVAQDQSRSAVNRLRIMRALMLGKRVLVAGNENGAICVDRTLVGSGDDITVAPGNSIKLADGKTCPLFRNAAAQAVIPASGINHSVSGEATFGERGHNREVGDRVYIYNVGGDAALLGVKTITARSENAWTVAATGTGTATGVAFVAPVDGYEFAAGTIKRGETAQATCNISGTTMTVTGGYLGVPFVDGMVVSGGTLSGQTIHGPMGAVQEGVGSTWTLSSSGGTQTGITVTGTPPANLVRVQEPGHSKIDGDPCWVGNTGGTDTFNGPQRVYATLPSCWYFETAGTTQETATGTAIILHDRKITLRGEWEGNYIAQVGAYYNSHGIILGNCSFDLQELSVGGMFKYAVWGFNNAKVDARLLRFNTRSDGFHLEAPWTHIHVRDVFGRNNDDVVSFTDNQLDSTWPELSSPSGSGDSDDALVENIHALWSPNSSIVKLAADLDHSVGTFVVRGLFGRAENGFYANRDIVGSGCKGRALIVEDVFVEGTQSGQSSPVKINADNLGTWDTIRIRNVPTIGSANNPTIYIQSASWKFLEIDPGCYITSPNVNPYLQMDGDANGDLTVFLHRGATLFAGAQKYINLNGAALGELVVTGGAWNGTSNNGWAIWQESGTLGKLRVQDTTVGAINQFAAQKSGLTTSPMTVFASGIHVITGTVPNAIFLTYSNTTIVAAGCVIENVNNFFFAPQAGTNRLQATDDCIFPAAKAIRNASGLTNSASGLGIKLDLGASAGTTPTGMTPIAGDRLWNTNGTGGGAYGRSAAGSWVSIF